MITEIHQVLGQPGTAHLIFFPEFAIVARANDGDCRKARCQVCRRGRIISQARKKSGFAAPGLVT